MFVGGNGAHTEATKGGGGKSTVRLESQLGSARDHSLDRLARKTGAYSSSTDTCHFFVDLFVFRPSHISRRHSKLLGMC